MPCLSLTAGLLGLLPHRLQFRLLLLRHSHLPRPLAFPLPALSLTLALPLLLLAPLLLVKALLLLQLLLALRQLVLGLTLKLLQRLVQHHEGIVRVGTGGGS